MPAYVHCVVVSSSVHSPERFSGSTKVHVPSGDAMVVVVNATSPVASVTQMLTSPLAATAAMQTARPSCEAVGGRWGIRRFPLCSPLMGGVPFPVPKVGRRMMGTEPAKLPRKTKNAESISANLFMASMVEWMCLMLICRKGKGKLSNFAKAEVCKRFTFVFGCAKSVHSSLQEVGS